MNFQDSADIQQLTEMNTPLHIGVTPRYVRKQQQQQTPATTSSNNTTITMTTPAMSLKTPKTPKVTLVCFSLCVFVRFALFEIFSTAILSVTLVFVAFTFVSRGSVV